MFENISSTDFWKNYSKKLEQQRRQIFNLLFENPGNLEEWPLESVKFTDAFNKVKKIKKEKDKLEKERLAKEDNLKKLSIGSYGDLTSRIDEEINKWEEENLSKWEEIESRIADFTQITSEKKEMKELIQEILRLKWQVKLNEKEIQDLEKEIKNLEEKLRISYGVLKKEIEEKEQELKTTKIECIKKMNHERGGYPIGIQWQGNYAGWVEDLLEIQRGISELNSNHYKQRKETLIKGGYESSSKLEYLCEIQEELVKLRKQLENTEKVINIVNNYGKYAGWTNTNSNFASVGDNSSGFIDNQQLPPKSNFHE